MNITYTEARERAMSLPLIYQLRIMLLFWSKLFSHFSYTNYRWRVYILLSIPITFSVIALIGYASIHTSYKGEFAEQPLRYFKFILLVFGITLKYVFYVLQKEYIDNHT